MDKSVLLKKLAIRAIDHCSTELQTVGNELWKKPELCFKEYFAHKLLTNYLENVGYIVKKSYVLETGFKASIGSKENGPNIAIVCEFDALPEIGHACGHNLIAEASMAAAVGLASAFQNSDESLGEITILGTPAEEGGGGKIDMLNAGVFEDIDLAMMVHPAPTTASHISMIAIDRVTVKYIGKTSNAAICPWKGSNAVDAAVLCYQNVVALKQQIKPCWMVNGIIKHGGSRPDAIPAYSELLFYLRTPTKVELDVLREKLKSCFMAAAIATNCQVEQYFCEKPYLNFVTNNKMADIFKQNAESIGVHFSSKEVDSSASSDMGNVSQVVPSIHPGFYIGRDVFPHTRAFCEATGDHKAHKYTLDQGKAMALTCIDLLTNPALVNDIKREFTDVI